MKHTFSHQLAQFVKEQPDTLLHCSKPLQATDCHLQIQASALPSSRLKWPKEGL